MSAFKLSMAFIASIAVSLSIFASSTFPPAKETYKILNQDDQFVVGVGTALSQANPVSKNTMHPDFILQQMHKMAFLQKNPRQWLGGAQRIWYLLNSMPNITCSSCGKTTTPHTLDLQQDKALVSTMLDDMIANSGSKKLDLSRCPHCQSGNIELRPIDLATWGPVQQAQTLDQIKALGLDTQIGAKSGLPVYRLSVELADVMQDGKRALDTKKLHDQAAWLKRVGNPFIFLFHYTLPINYLDLFETEEGIEFFANFAQEFVRANPQITHICPISQPMAFSQRVARQMTLPPFESKLTPQKLFENLMKAHVLAYKKIKAVNPNVKVYICHQYKPMIPFHNSSFDPRYSLEKFICSLADRFYNQACLNEFKKHEKYIDGLAISVYPPLYFNMWIPIGDNSSGIVDGPNSLQAIMQMHKAFPSKEIIVTETGCNSDQPEIQDTYFDMMLDVCKQARDLGVKIYGCLFWAPTRDSQYYREWNTKLGSSNFGMFKSMDPRSILPFGQYIKDSINRDEPVAK